MKKFLVSLLIVLTLTGFAFAGGKQASSSGKIELNFLEVMTSTGRTEVFNQIIAEYETLHPNVKINLISPPYDQADNRLSMSLTAKEPLDIIEVRDMTASQFVTNKWLTDLSPYVEKWSGWADFLSTGRDLAAAAGGKPYLIPQFFYVPALYVRTDVLAKLGITKLPETLAELFAISKQITNPSQNQFGYTIRGRGNPFRQADLMVLSSVRDVDTTSFYKLKNGTNVFDSPDYLAALTAYVDLYKNAVPSDGVNWGFNEQISSFASGITPFLMQDPDAVPEVDKLLSRDQYTVIPMPVGNTGTFYYEPGFAGLGIPSYAKNKDAAWDFITFMSSPERNAMICKNYGALPVHSSTFANDSYFSSGVYKAWNTILSQPQKYVTVRYPYTSEKYPGWAQVHEQFLQSTFLGQTTPAQAVKAWSDYWK
ncbi:sugar ABC transporter substrate-binding protein [Spirochaetia bacterium]|nr:sugar ABC transporter substrate-binding protein [Spirochaetia bacterium]